MRRNILSLLSTAVLMFLTLMANAQNGITIKKSLDGSKGELVANAAIMIQDSTYFDAALQSKLEPSYPVKNAVTLKINEYSPVYATGPFTATANVRVIYLRPDKVLDSVEKTLAINYDTTTAYKGRNSFVFNNAHRVTLKVLSITCSKPALIGMLMLDNEMNVKPVFKLDAVTDAVKSITMTATANTDSTDELEVRWGAVTGADEYDLEWAFIDSTALAANRYGTPVNSNLVFRNNASRVSVSQNVYRVPLMYDNGGILYVRVRAVQVKDKFKRTETNWFSDFTAGKGAFSFTGHQRKLNWQSNISFAEEGKRKVVVQYFDGSLLNRQTVTKDNVAQTTMVAETMYDQQGRPAIQVLPAPTLSNIIKYTKNFNTAVNGAEYDKAQYDSLPSPDQYLNVSANQMGTGKGAANYYSAQNANANQGIEKFVPDAEKYPFTETVYTPDNTGRISRQGGVGATYRINGRRETIFSYGTAFQNDLDAIFGTDAGDESHYFKNMVRDANGQYSVSYLDMHGRTIATALAGSADSARLKDLPTNVIVPVLDTLSGINKTTFGDLELISHKSLPVAMKEIYTFSYSLIPPVLKKKNCNNIDVCYIGKFDLTIKISDDSYNQLLGGSPVIKTFTNYNAGVVVSDCAAPAPITLSFSIELPKGNYEVVKTLKINEEALDAYRNTIFLPGSVCTSLDKIIQQQRVLRKDTTCAPTCQSCLTGLGTYTTFATRYMQQMGLLATDSVAYRAEISTAYANGAEACNLLCQKVSESELVRKAMLADMTAPSGQYANPDSTRYEYSIFNDKNGLKTPRFQDTTIVYLDADGKQAMAFNENTNQWVRPQSLLPAQFAAKFQPSWANALLRFHPEYCSLLEFEKHKQSQLWDDSFRLVDTYADAKAKGYLNPTNGSEFLVFGSNPSNIDPLVLENGGAYRTAIEDSLRNYKGKGYSMWAISAMRLFCPYNDGNCVANFGNNANVFKEGTMCSGDLNMIWRSFRENYLQQKSEFIQKLVEDAACPAGAAKVRAVDLSAANMVPNFNTAANVFANSNLDYLNNNAGSNPDVNAIRDSSNTAMQQSFTDNCNAYVSTWMQQLSACPYSAADWATIKTQLLAVCKAGSDGDHPFGASSVPDGVILENRSFEDVIRKYNIAHNINVAGCNGLLLTIPAPYYKQAIVSDKPVFTKPKDCECEKINALKTEYDAAHYSQETFSGYLSRTRKLKISQATLDDLLNACNASGGCTYVDNPVAIPPVFQCFTPAPCTNCRVVDSLYTKFKSTYALTPLIPIADTLQQRTNELFAAYMNNQLGYGLSAADYLTFRDSCARSVVGDTVVSINKPYIFSYPVGTYGAKIIDMKSTRDGGFIMAGYTYSITKSQDKALVIKATSTGAVAWAKTYDVGTQQDYFLKINEMVDGSLIAGGISRNAVTRPGELAAVPSFGTLVKMDAQGNVIWKRGIYSGSGTGDDVRDAIELRNGDIAFTGDFDAYSYTCDITAGVLSNTGNLKWLRKMGTPTSDIAQGIIQSNDTLMVAGLTSTGYFNANIIKLGSATGNFLERRSYDHYLKKDIWGFYNLPGGGSRMVTTASTDNGSTNGQGEVIDINSNGSVKKAIRFSRPLNLDTYFFASGKLSDGSMLLAPSLNESNDGVYVMKMNADYTLAWQRKLQRRMPDTQVRGIWPGINNTIMAGGNLGSNPAMFAFGSNGVALCNDSILPITTADVTSGINVTTPGLDSNVLVTTTAFDFNLTVVNLPITPANEFCGAGSGSIALYKGPILCGQSKPTFEEVPLEVVNNCADSSFYLVNTATEIYKAVTDSLRDDFNTAYINSCMQAASRELFTMSHGLAEYHYTLYYYDQAGNLVKTIPPAGAVVDRSTAWLNSVRLARSTGASKVPAHKLPTKYRYNTLNQVVEQVSPDGGISRFWYDRLGRLAVSQNAKQQVDKYYSYTLYDYLGRIAEVGQLKSDAAITNVISRSDAKLKQWLDAVKTTRTQITQTAYDEAYFPTTPYFAANNLRNRVAWNAVYNAYPDIASLEHATATYYSYDIHGNVDTLLQDYNGNTMDITQNRFKKLAYDYDLISGKVNKVSYQAGSQDAFYHRYTYDAENRITNVETSTDDFYWENEAFYQYYKHGPLAKAIIGQQQVQGLDYAYTLQGWLKGVNGSSLTPAFNMSNDGIKGSLVAKDAFGYALHYYGDNEYKPIGTNANMFAAGAGKDTSIFKPLFNGNISAMSVNMPAVGEPLVYTYRYDVLNRLSSMTAAKGLNTSTNLWTPLKLNDFGEAITYDGNGNILSYIRNGNNTFAGKSLIMDSLVYSYKPNSNQLDYIDDKVKDGTLYSNDIDDQSAGNYSYDAIGNLISDKGSNIDSIYWTVYGKIQRIKKKDGTVITFTYDAAGNRVSKRVKNTETWYVRDATGNVMGVYTSGDANVNNGDLSLIESDIYGSSRLGILNRQVNVQHLAALETTPMTGLGNGINTIFNRGNKVFELTNHLGNVLATVSDRKRPVSVDGSTVDHYDPILSTAQEYYPFGSLLVGRGGMATAGGWVAGNDNINGYTVPSNLTVSSRSNNQPSEYVATEEIVFADGFDTGAGDSFTAYIADSTYAGGGGSGSGGSGVNGAMVYRYGFNGKENDNEVKGEGSQQDYGMRVYDPRIAKFLSVDPITAKYPMLTPYQFASNSPILNIDLDGAEALSSMADQIRTMQEANIAIYGPEKAKKWNAALRAGVTYGSLYGLKFGFYVVLAAEGGPQVAIPALLSDLTGAPVLPAPQAMSGGIASQKISQVEGSGINGAGSIAAESEEGAAMTVYQQRFMSLRQTITSVGKTRNIAYTEGIIAGEPISEVAVSGEALRPGSGLIDMPEKTFFETTTVGHPRAFDSEVKLMESLANKFDQGSLSANRKIFGKIRIVSELPLCESCNGVVQQFKDRFPNIQVSYVNGQTTTIITAK